MNNWVQYQSMVDNVFVKLNMGKQPTIELIPSPVDGDSPNDLFITLLYDCINVVNALQDQFGIKVGRLQLGSRGVWLVYDPIASKASK